MSTFQLDVLTPERRFFSDQVEAVTVNGIDGEMTILKNHEPIVAVLAIGKVRFKLKDGTWRTAVNSQGFIEVEHEGVTIYVQACEWPEEIDINRAKAAKERAERRLREQRSLMEYHHTQISLARAMARLRATTQRSIDTE